MCFDFANHRRPKVPIRKLSPSGSIKTEVHAPGFYEFASKFYLIRAQSARKRHADSVPFSRPFGALSPAVFRQSRNRQGRRTAVRRIKFPIKFQLCRTLIPLPAPPRRGLGRCADERGLSPPVSPEPGAYLRGTASPLEESEKRHPIQGCLLKRLYQDALRTPGI